MMRISCFPAASGITSPASYSCESTTALALGDKFVPKTVKDLIEKSPAAGELKLGSQDVRLVRADLIILQRKAVGSAGAIPALALILQRQQ